MPIIVFHLNTIEPLSKEQGEKYTIKLIIELSKRAKDIMLWSLVYKAWVSLLLGHFKNSDGCNSDPPKVVHFGGSYTGATIFLESPK